MTDMKTLFITFVYQEMKKNKLINKLTSKNKKQKKLHLYGFQKDQHTR